MALRDSITEKTGLPLGMVATLLTAALAVATFIFTTKADVAKNGADISRNAADVARLEARMGGMDAQQAKSGDAVNALSRQVTGLDVKMDILLQQNGVRPARGHGR